MANYHGGQPAVNIKCYKGIFDAPLPLDLGRYSEDGGETWIDQKTDPEYTHDWIAKNMSDEDLMNWWDIVASDVIGFLIEESRDLFQEAGYDVEIYSAGRSSGWLEVHGLEDTDWSEDLKETWKTFETYCEEAVENFPSRLSTELYVGVFEARKAKKEDKEEQVKAIWKEVENFLFGRTGNTDPRTLDIFMSEIREYCPLLTALVEGIRK